MITIFTDGSARGNPGPGGWAAVVADAERVFEIGGRSEHTTNNKMELTAVIEALKHVSSEERVKLHTDSEYVVKGITIWAKGWLKNNWRTAAKKPVLNQELWQDLLHVVDGRQIEWVVVPGHSNVLANERCDEIATAFADGLEPELYDGPRSGYKVSLVGHVAAR